LKDIETVFRDLHAAGLSVALEGEFLRVRPTSMVTAKLANAIRERKQELMRCLVRSDDLPRCTTCQGELIAITTFDGFENLECIRCDQCFGCRLAKALTLSEVMQ